MKHQKLTLPRLAGAYAVGILVFYPWASRGLVDIAPFKLGVLVAFTFLTLLLLCLLGGEAPAGLLQKRPQGRTLWVLAWALLGGVSTALAPSPAAALWGEGGYVGGWMLCLLCLAGYLLLAFGLRPGMLPWLQKGMILSGAGVGLLGVLNNFGFDPLGVYPAISPAQWNIFFSTIGNVDYLNSYFCLWLPLAVWLFLQADTRADRLFGGLGAAAGFVCLAALDPGIASLGLAFAFLVLLWVRPLAGREPARLCLLAVFLAGAQWLVQALHQLRSLRMVERPFALLGRSAAALPLMLLFGAAALLLRKKPPRPSLRAQRAAVLVCLAGAAGLLVWRNLPGQTASLGGFDNLFVLGPGWATGRGAIFADAVYLFAAAPPLRWLLGYGAGSMAALMQQAAVPYPLADAIGAHNEYLDLLLHYGLAGLAAWLGVLASHLRRGLLQKQTIGWALALCAYAGQAFFNNRVAAVFPLAAAMLGLLRVPQTQETPNEPAGSLWPCAFWAAAGMAVSWAIACFAV